MGSSGRRETILSVNDRWTRSRRCKMIRTNNLRPGGATNAPGPAHRR
jgi:hypothetical protein